MGATLSLMWLTPGKAFFCHAGDSRIYRLNKQGEMTQLTHDHTHAGWLFREGKINEREARNHDDRHALEMSLGGKRKEVVPQTGAVSLNPGDEFILCTDGLVEGLWDRTMVKLIRNPPPYADSPNPARRLLDEALSVYGRDNTTVVVLKINDRGR